MNGQRNGGDPLWYKDAIVYEVHVRAFRDANGDGKGDFRGLAEKLDYLADLGVTAIWVLPFYPSPGRDDGYDIADYTAVNPDYGNLRDVKLLIREAHKRGLRVITELVCNHTSDQHPWFQRARRAKPGSAAREFYVWSDSPDVYPDARIIFKDFETSNWTWDPVAGAYYWHRFYSHQPDLNFDNPRVREAIFEVMDQWLEMGVDGLRLDAIPYLYERDGTNCENLAETHGFLKELRAHIDEQFADRMLLAEANQWPEDSVEYFGDGDECHMAFHFPVMPRMFMAIRMEDRFPIVDILAQTPPIPDNAQWALFLRNHDELTLEMVTDEERDYMYRAYAADPQARINLGIRRRLAPLLGNNRRRIELMNGLLFALPGTPVLYYGDEIGMGDNVYLGDRNGVRTPMQWSGDRNAGFSSANRQSLYLPVIVDPEYHYEAINVEAQQANPHSLLWWTKRLIALRKRHPAFGRGTIEFLQPENRRILAFIRQHEDETLLVVANLSRFPQYGELDLSAFAGSVPVEMFGRVEFPAIRQAPYFLSLGPHAFLWFELEKPPAERRDAAAGSHELPHFANVAEPAGLLTGRSAGRFSDTIAAWIRERRWFRGKARTITSTEISDSIELPLPDQPGLIIVVTVTYSEGEPEQYLVPLVALSADEATRLTAESPGAAIATLGERADLFVVDGMRVPAVSEALLEIVARRRTVRGAKGQLVGRPGRALSAVRGPAADRLGAVPVRAEQSNTSVVLGDRLMLKLYRRLEGGTSTDLEVALHLTNRGFESVPAVAGSLEYRAPGGEASSAAMLSAFVPNEGDVWELTLDAAGEYLERAAISGVRADPGAVSSAVLLAGAAAELPQATREAIGTYLDTAWLLGRRTGEMHLALAGRDGDGAFAPEPFSALYQRSLYQSIIGAVRANLRLLGRRIDTLPDGAREDARRLLASEDRIDARTRGLVGGRFGGMRIRIHGDYHLGQVLHTGRDVSIIDFEGEPGRPIGERRLKRSPLTDVAGMLRSFDYAAREATMRAIGSAAVRDEDVSHTETWARHWYRAVATTFLRGYRETTAGDPILPADDAEWAVLLDALLIGKAAYELSYELNNRPAWVSLPLRGILELIEP